MTDSSQQPKGRGRGLPALKAAINVLNVVKEATSNTPAGPAVVSVAALLTVILVSSFPFRHDLPKAHTQSGHDGQQRGFR